jgi:hypothetical protein
MQDTFEARNELEEKLLAAQEGQLSSDDFMGYLLDTQVFMPVKDSIGIEGFTSSDKAIPLTLKTEDNIEVLILFTSPDRAKEFVHEFRVMKVACWRNSAGCWSVPAAVSGSPSTRTGRSALTWNRKWSSI